MRSSLSIIWHDSDGITPNCSNMVRLSVRFIRSYIIIQDIIMQDIIMQDIIMQDIIMQDIIITLLIK